MNRLIVVALIGALARQCNEAQTNAFANASNTGEKNMTVPRHVYPPMEMPSDWGRTPNPPGRETMLPDVIAGNAADIEPGKSAVLLKMEGADNIARMYTISVYHRDSDPTALFNASAPIPGTPFSRFYAPHRVLIEFGVGGQGSEQLWVDLKRGFKVAVPASSITVTVFNATPLPLPVGLTDPRAYDISVGASIAPGNSSNNDGLTLTVPVNDVAPAVLNFLAVPPFAKSHYLFVANKDATKGGANIAYFQKSDDSAPGVISPGNLIVYTDIAAQPFPIGPIPIANGACYIGFLPAAAWGHNVNFNVVWQLAL